jgi:hypothetical protein
MPESVAMASWYNSGCFRGIVFDDIAKHDKKAWVNGYQTRPKKSRKNLTNFVIILLKKVITPRKWLVKPS